MKRSIVSMLFLVLGSMLWAQQPCDITVTGQVIDQHDGSALSFAVVVVEGTTTGVQSDSLGRYRLPGLCRDSIVLVGSHVGCQPVKLKVYLTKDTTINFYPEHHAELLEFIVTETREIEVDVLPITRIEPSQLPVRNGLGQYLETVNGVNLLSTGSNISKPMVRGLHSNRLLILNNGVRQEGQQWGNEHAPEIDPAIADNIVVVKGPRSVQFGPDALGGVVIVNPAKLPIEYGLNGSVSLSGQTNGRGGQGSLMLEGRHERLKALQWRIQGSAKKIGDVEAPDYILSNTGVEELDFSTELALSDEKKGLDFFYSQFNTNLGILSASHIGNLTDLDQAFASERPLIEEPFSYEIRRPFQRVEHELAKTMAWWYPDFDTDLRLVYGRQYNLRQEFDKHRSSDGDPPSLSFEIVTHSLDLTLDYRKLNRHAISTGISGLMQANTFEGRFFIPNFRKWNAGAFVLDRWFSESGWIFEAGARMDYLLQRVYLREGDLVRQIDHPYAQPSASIGVIRSLSKTLQWSTSIASAWRPPNVNELYSNGLHHGAATFEIGDTNLAAEVSYAINSNLIWERERIKIEVEPYVNYIPAFIYLAPRFPTTLTIRGAFPTFAYAQTEALLYGIDGQINWQVHDRVELISQTSILRARDLAIGDWIPQMPADQSSLALLVKLGGERFEYTAQPRLQWVNKQWRIPSVGDYVTPPSAFWLTHFQLAMKHKELSVQLDIQNLFNHRYRNYLNRYRYFADEMGRNIAFRILYRF